MSSDIGSVRGYLGGLILTVASGLALLAGFWWLLITFQTHPVFLLASLIVGLVLLFCTAFLAFGAFRAPTLESPPAQIGQQEQETAGQNEDQVQDAASGTTDQEAQEALQEGRHIDEQTAGSVASFNSTKTVPYVVDDLAPVAQDLMRYFEDQDFEVTETHLPGGGVQVSIRRGGTFKAIIGMKTALNIKVEPVEGGTKVDAGVGIWGQQAIPTIITALVFWPVIISQVWNMAQEAKLDEEAFGVAEESLKAHASGAPSPISQV